MGERPAVPGWVQDKIVLVTGAGSGIGRATALLLAQEGATVVVSDINPSAAEQVAGEIQQPRGRGEAARLDVADEAGWTAVLDRILSRHRRLDVLVNNAGRSFAKPVAEMALDEWRWVLSVNLDGVFLGIKHAIRAMRAGGGGSIINVASVSGINAYPEAGAYGASKAAVRLLSRVAAIECADAQAGIRVNVVTPAGVKTPMWETMDFFQRLMAQHGGTEAAFAALAGSAGSQQFFTPEEVARTVLYLASEESAHLNGMELILAQGHVG
jgi:NAD(P)-dependent dehydrogenase (short-subunit alcohol dehydrogenase family)